MPRVSAIARQVSSRHHMTSRNELRDTVYLYIMAFATTALGSFTFMLHLTNEQRNISSLPQRLDKRLGNLIIAVQIAVSIGTPANRSAQVQYIILAHTTIKANPIGVK